MDKIYNQTIPAVRPVGKYNPPQRNVSVPSQAPVYNITINNSGNARCYPSFYYTTSPGAFTNPASSLPSAGSGVSETNVGNVGAGMPSKKPHPLFNADGSPVLNPDGTQAYGIQETDEEGNPLYNADGSPILEKSENGTNSSVESSFKNGDAEIDDVKPQPLFNADGSPVLNPDGTQAYGVQATDEEGNPLFNEDGSPVLKDDVAGNVPTAGAGMKKPQPLFNADGSPVLNPDGTQACGIQATDENGNPLYNADGSPVLISGADAGSPITDSVKNPNDTVKQPQPLFNADGSPVLNPDGTQAYGVQATDKDGNPLYNADGSPVLENSAGNYHPETGFGGGYTAPSQGGISDAQVDKIVEAIKSINKTDNKKGDKDGEKDDNITMLTSEYVQSLENYLRNPNKEIREMGAKEVIARFEEDDGRKGNPSLTALLNLMLQDPKSSIRMLALSAIAGGQARGDDLTMQLLSNLEHSKRMQGQEAMLAAEAKLRAVSETAKDRKNMADAAEISLSGNSDENLQTSQNPQMQNFGYLPNGDKYYRYIPGNTENLQ